MIGIAKPKVSKALKSDDVQRIERLGDHFVKFMLQEREIRVKVWTQVFWAVLPFFGQKQDCFVKKS